MKEMYVPGEEDRKGVKKYHTAKYGPVEKFGYKDFIPMFKAEKFSAENWIGLMDEAGAKFGGIVSTPRWFLFVGFEVHQVGFKRYGT